ncbi:MAG: site-specific integrase [Cyanobium sp. CZS 25K]|nr:site-specific integrase [Cyanobium sp. CZS25K]
MRQQNRQLAASGTGLRLEIRQRRLGLRGPLPCPNGTAARPVQRISLGLPTTTAGVAAALDQLAQVRESVEQGSFAWDHWRRRPAAAPPPPLETTIPADSPADVSAVEAAGVRPLLAGFEAAFFADPRRRRRPAGSRSTWSGAYRPYLRRLVEVAASTHGAAAVDAPLLERVLETYPLASRSRQQCGIALGALARHLQLPLPDDWSERSGGYGLHVARFRGLPSDARILELAAAIPNPRWRLAYGLMATYGLRNHEVFFCDLSALAPGGDRVLRVLPTSKTGEHQVWPFQPDWVERFGLEGLAEAGAELPRVCTDLRRTTLQQVGRRVAEQFRRYGLPITPYDLRHAWAVRTIHIGLPDTVAARMMGHSVAIHTRTYHHWITRRDQQQAVDTALARLRAS